MGRLNSVLRERPSVSRSNLKEKSMSLKLDLIMPTRPTQRDLSQSSATRVNFVKQSSSMKMKLVPVHRFLNKLASLSARLPLFQEKLRRARHSLMVLNVLSAKFKEILLTPELQ